jgi:hypothetical protein
MRRLLKFGCLGILGFIVLATIVGALVPRSDRAGSAQPPAASPAETEVTADDRQERQATATAHYETALALRDEGELGLAIEEAEQSLAVWGHPNPARTLWNDLVPRASLTARAIERTEAAAAAPVATAPPVEAARAPAPAKPAGAPPPAGAGVVADLTGRGQQLTQTIALKPGLTIISLSHNGSGNFAVWLVDAAGNRVDLLVNVIGSFNGSKALGLERAGDYTLNVQADGGWAIRVRQPDPAPETASTSFSGNGQQATPMFRLATGLKRFTLTHQGTGNFAVWLRNGRGDNVDLLTNVIGPFDGSKGVQIRQAGVYILTVQANGPWSITVE